MVIIQESARFNAYRFVTPRRTWSHLFRQPASATGYQYAPSKDGASGDQVRRTSVAPAIGAHRSKPRYYPHQSEQVEVDYMSQALCTLNISTHGVRSITQLNRLIFTDKASLFPLGNCFVLSLKLKITSCCTFPFPRALDFSTALAYILISYGKGRLFFANNHGIHADYSSPPCRASSREEQLQRNVERDSGRI